MWLHVVRGRLICAALCFNLPLWSLTIRCILFLHNKMQARPQQHKLRPYANTYVVVIVTKRSRCVRCEYVVRCGSLGFVLHFPCDETRLCKCHTRTCTLCSVANETGDCSVHRKYIRNNSMHRRNFNTIRRSCNNRILVASSLQQGCWWDSFNCNRCLLIMRKAITASEITSFKITIN